MTEYFKLIGFSDLTWTGTAHRFCIDNPIVSTILILCWIAVSISYIRFVEVNKKIRLHIMERDGEFATEKTFRWFSYVFYTCSATRIVSLITFFLGIYWLSAAIHLINALSIIYTLRVYKSQFQLFTARSFSESQVNDKIIERENEILENAKLHFQNLNISEQKKIELANIITKHNV